MDIIQRIRISFQLQQGFGELDVCAREEFYIAGANPVFGAFFIVFERFLIISLLVIDHPVIEINDRKPIWIAIFESYLLRFAVKDERLIVIFFRVENILSNTRIKIFELFRENKIVIPFPQRVVQITKM